MKNGQEFDGGAVVGGNCFLDGFGSVGGCRAVGMKNEQEFGGVVDGGNCFLDEFGVVGGNCCLADDVT